MTLNPPHGFSAAHCDCINASQTDCFSSGDGSLHSHKSLPLRSNSSDLWPQASVLSAPGGKIRAENSHICTSSLGKVSRFSMRLSERITIVMCNKGMSATILNSTNPGWREKKKQTSLSLLCLSWSPLRRTLLSDTVLFSRIPHDQHFFIGIQTQHWKHSTSHQIWVSSPSGCS